MKARLVEMGTRKKRIAAVDSGEAAESRCRFARTMLTYQSADVMLFL